MKNEHLQFVTEYMRLKDKEAAYKIAYPDSQPESAYSSAKRLLTRPDIKEYLDETYDRMRKEAEEEVKERMKGEIISAHTAQVVLSQIIMGQHIIPKEVNVKGRLETIEVRPTHSAIISALNAFFRLSGMYPGKGSKPQTEKPVQHSGLSPELAEMMQKMKEKESPHPYGDTYPTHYRGPYYDPGDPNTREIFLNLMERFRKEALENGQPFHMYNAHLNGTAINPYSLDGKTPYFYNWQQDDAIANRQQSATIGNNNPESSFPVLRPACRTGREDGPQGGKGHTQQEQPATISNNLPTLPWWMPLNGAYQYIDRLMAHCYADSLQDKPGSKELYEKLKLMEKCKNMTPDIASKAEAGAGWEYHPTQRRLILPKQAKKEQGNAA